MKQISENKNVKCQYRTTKWNKEPILVYVNHNSTKKWYEAYDLLNDTHFEPTKEYLLTKTTPRKGDDFTGLTRTLKNLGKIENGAIIVDRLPNFK